ISSQSKTVNTNAEEDNQIQRNLQITADLGTIRDSKKNHTNLNRFVSGQRIPYRKKSITHDINHTQPTPGPTPPRQHITTTAPHHLHLRSVAAAATTPLSNPSQPPPPHFDEELHRASLECEPFTILDLLPLVYCSPIKSNQTLIDTRIGL
ncbi:hypothetical protein L195_g047528, partial [Trifolium pratense]